MKCIRCNTPLTGRQTKYCKKSCSTSDLIDKRRKKFKKDAVNYKGGKCERCGYNKCLGALDFHHLDPSKKEFILSAMYRYNWELTVVPELDKCILVCKNCHTEIHTES